MARPPLRRSGSAITIATSAPAVMASAPPASNSCAAVSTSCFSDTQHTMRLAAGPAIPAGM